jgi:hypothetical protein
VIASEDAGESNEEGMVRPQRAGRLPTQRHSSRVRWRTRLTRLYCIDSDCSLHCRASRSAPIWRTVHR